MLHGCGFTCEDLERIYAAARSKGFEILDFHLQIGLQTKLGSMKRFAVLKFGTDFHS